jgi:hypothetical protein
MCSDKLGGKYHGIITEKSYKDNFFLQRVDQRLKQKVLAHAFPQLRGSDNLFF